jgi:ABC-2 type transport system permease protein
MKLHRIYGIIIRYIFLFRHSFDRLSDVFYWPTIDLLLWGLTSLYFQSFAPNANQFILVIVSGLLFWIIVWRGQYEISVNLLEDLWNKNLINIFVAPVRFSDWIVSFLIIGVIKALVSLSFAMLIAFLLYKVQIFFYGFYLIPFMFLLIMTGWWIGFILAGIILRYGTRLQTIAWTMVMGLSPFSAVFYPLSILPSWAQTIAHFIPTSYVFEGAREVIFRGTLDPNKLLISFILNLIYLALALLFLKKSFNKALNKGLVKLF